MKINAYQKLILKLLCAILYRLACNKYKDDYGEAKIKHFNLIGEASEVIKNETI